MSEQNIGIWKALFEFAQRVGSNDPVNANPSSASTATDENRRWLENALSAYVNESDPIKLMKEQIRILLDIDLQTPSVEYQTKGISALDTLNDLCEDVDNASDFMKIGGVRILTPLLASSFSQFRCLAAELIGNLAQNHIYCQGILNELFVLQVLCELLDKDPEDSVKVKALYAISCLIRQNERVQQDFVKMNGIAYLINACRSSNDRLKIKATFLLSSILKENVQWKRVALDMEIVSPLISTLDQTNSQVIEHAMLTLLSLINHFSEAIEVCRRPDLALKTKLERRIDEIANTSEYADELAVCREVLNECWSEERN